MTSFAEYARKKNLLKAMGDRVVDGELMKSDDEKNGEQVVTRRKGFGRGRVTRSVTPTIDDDPAAAATTTTTGGNRQEPQSFKTFAKRKNTRSSLFGNNNKGATKSSSSSSSSSGPPNSNGPRAATDSAVRKKKSGGTTGSGPSSGTIRENEDENVASSTTTGGGQSFVSYVREKKEREVKSKIQAEAARIREARANAVRTKAKFPASTKKGKQTFASRMSVIAE